ncbi:MAG TPA: hypothetical protein VFC07_06420, partial [Verrucomicrobiae bacterium]|nr:hypothetical protein [Verrucomicrobiae bacterium]
MKNFAGIFALTCIMALLGSNARAFTYSYWDGATDAPPGGLASPTGIWENANWSTVTGTTAPANNTVSTTAVQTYVESSDAHFCAGTASTGTYVITINNPHTVSGFDLDTVGNCTLTGPGVLSLTSTGDGFAVNTGATLTINNVINGTTGGFINMSKTGFNGTLVLNAVNTFTGAASFGGVRCVTGTV